MPLGGLLSAGVSVVGGLIGQGAASGDRAQAQQAYQAAQAALQAVGNAPDESKALLLQQYRDAGTLNPQLEQAIQQGPSAAAGVTTDPALQSAQMGALQSLQQQATGGMTPQARAALNQVNQQAGQQAQAQSQAVMQQMRARGQGGSGAELAAALSGGQNAANMASQQSDQIMAQNQNAAQQAALSSGQLGGQMQAQQFGMNMAKAQAQDQLNRFNVQSQQQAQQANVGAQNQAQAANLANLQNVGNANTSSANQELNRQAQAAQQQWQSNLALAQAKAGASSQFGNQMNQQGQQAAQSWSNIGSGVGTGLATAFGPKASSGGSGGGTTNNYYNQGGPVKDFKSGGHVDGKAKVKGDSPKNDTVNAKLSPGEIVVPRTMADSALGKSILKLVERHNEIKKTYAPGGEHDRLLNHIQSIMPSKMHYGGEFAQGYSDGEEVQPVNVDTGGLTVLNPGERNAMLQAGRHPGDPQDVASWRKEQGASPAPTPDKSSAQGAAPTPYQKFADYSANQPNMAMGGKVMGYADGEVVQPESDPNTMAADFRVAQNNPRQYPMGAGPSAPAPIVPPQIQDMGEVDADTSRKQQALQQEQADQDSEDQKVSEVAKKHSGKDNKESADEAIDSAFQLESGKQDAANRDLEHEMGAADEKAGAEAMKDSEKLSGKSDSEGEDKESPKAQISIDQSPGQSPVDRLLSATKPESSYSQQFKDAQQRQDDAELINQMGKAGALIGAGIARVEPSKEALQVFDQNIKLAQQAVPELQRKLDMEKHDPQSPTSQAYRQFYTQLMGKQPPANWSASDMEKVSPMFEKYMQAKEMAASRRETMQDRMQQQSQDKQRHDELMAQLKREGFSNTAAQQAAKEEVRVNNLGQKTDKDIDGKVYSARNALGQASRTVIFADKIPALLNQYPDLNQAPSTITNDVNLAFANLISQGPPGQQVLKTMFKGNLPQSASEFWQMLTAEPNPARQKEMMNLLKDSAQKQKELAEAQIKDYVIPTLKQAELSGLKDPQRDIILRKHRITPDEYQNWQMGGQMAAQATGQGPKPSSNTVTIKRKSDGMTKTLPADAAQKYLKDPSFEQVK